VTMATLGLAAALLLPLAGCTAGSGHEPHSVPPVPAELLADTDVRASADGASPAADRLGTASEPVPWDSIERGIGVIAFRETDGSVEPRVDTMRIRDRPSATAPLAAMVVFDERGPGGWYTLLAAPGVRRNMAEIGYEELAVPFDSLAGGWARVVYGQDADGRPVRGWVDTDAGGVRVLRWADLLRRYGLFLPDPQVPRFHDAPGSVVLDLRLIPPNTADPDYDMEPMTTSGEWMQVRIRVPSICSGEPGGAERIAWIRYLDPVGRPLVWPRTRGC
jgi:hypothetical protein